MDVKTRLQQRGLFLSRSTGTIMPPIGFAAFVLLAVLAYVGMAPQEKETPRLMADVVIPANGGKVVLVRRAYEPYQG